MTGIKLCSFRVRQGKPTQGNRGRLYMPYPANKGLFIRDGTAWTPWTHELVGTGAALFRHGMVSVNGAALV